MVVQECLYAADARTNGAADALGCHIATHFKSAICHCLPCGGKGEQGVIVVVACRCTVDTFCQWVEILHLGSQFDWQVVGGNVFDKVDGTDTINKPVPQSLYIVSQRGNTP